MEFNNLIRSRKVDHLSDIFDRIVFIANVVCNVWASHLECVQSLPLVINRKNNSHFPSCDKIYLKMFTSLCIDFKGRNFVNCCNDSMPRVLMPCVLYCHFCAQGVELAKYFEGLVSQEPAFEIQAERHLGLVIFRLKVKYNAPLIFKA